MSIVNTPWYVPNTLLHTDLQIPTVIAEITNFSTKYREKLTTHPQRTHFVRLTSPSSTYVSFVDYGFGNLIGTYVYGYSMYIGLWAVVVY